jgi:hypothetical protein
VANTFPCHGKDRQFEPGRERNMNHSPCIVENSDFGAWEKVKKPFPYGWFFDYYQVKSGKYTYFDRKNKLDKVFDWICKKLKHDNRT